MSKEQRYYELLARTDHPVFAKDFSASTTISSPLNSIYNRVYAKSLVRLNTVLDELNLNTTPDTATAMTIDDWELNFFGFVKSSLSLSQRISELLIKFNKRIKMSVPDAISISESIVGKTPVIVRNVNLGGWILGEGALGISTILSASGPGTEGFYLVSFTEPVDSALLARLDERLTVIEKAGSRHRILAPIKYWELGSSALGIDTTLGG